MNESTAEVPQSPDQEKLKRLNRIIEAANSAGEDKLIEALSEQFDNQ